MYIIGDSTCASNVAMWKDVIGILESRKQIGPMFRLRCPQHPNTELIVSKPEDFEVVSPEGGCREICGKRLECGHSCEFLCHSDLRHKVGDCRKPCERGRPACGHGCQKRCSDKCGNCEVVIKDVRLPCGHTLPELQCWKAQDLSKSKPPCPTRVKRILSQCGHEVEMGCWESPDYFKCKVTCGGLLACKHGSCNSPCYMCPKGPDGVRQHSPCSKICDKDFTTCSHRCSRRCHSEGDCGHCGRRCELSCTHSRCSGKCGEHCVPCAEPCTWSCEHYGQCNMPCGAPCDRLPCDRRCERVLPCGHRCPSICGEVCPTEKLCQNCCPSQVKESVVEYLEFSTYEQIDLDVDPIIILPCGHFYTRSYMDCALEMDKVYAVDANNKFIRSIPNGSMTSQRANCQICRMPVSQIQRYNRVIKRSILDTILRNVISQSQTQYLELVKSFDEFKDALELDRNTVIEKLRPIRSSSERSPVSTKNVAIIVERMKAFDPMKKNISKYLQDVNEARQPHMKVYRMSIAAQSRAKADIDGVPGVYWPSDVPSPYIKHRLLGNILDCRLELSRNAEMIQFINRLSSLAGSKTDATPLYKKVITDCTKVRSKALKYRTECKEHHYHSLSVELIILQIELLALTIRASDIVERSNTEPLRDIGSKLLDDCEQYFQKYPSCKRYQPAAERAGTLLRELSPFYEAVSPEERSAVYQAMREEFGSVVRWYYCRNGHPVKLPLV